MPMLSGERGKKSLSQITISVGGFYAWFIASFSWFIRTSVRMGIRSHLTCLLFFRHPIWIHWNNFQSNALNHHREFFSLWILFFAHNKLTIQLIFFLLWHLREHSNESKTNDLKFIIIYRNLLHIIQINRLFARNGWVLFQPSPQHPRKERIMSAYVIQMDCKAF